ncbi:MAG: AraC family transcriptional regulator [Cyanobacteria bacterium RYN_339]|nr:AraC family transcriptional regulator [Cyanobacteria bacterium RYN_339]
MPNDFEIKILAPRFALAQTSHTTRPEIGATLGRIFPAVMERLTQLGVRPTGAPYARYLTMSEQGFDLEGGLPVDQPVAAGDGFLAVELPGGTFGFTIHEGPYEGLPAAHEALGAWLQADGWLPAGAPWESYVTDPADDPDATTWKTEIFMPVRRP